tara:strand:- start:521 stop:1312 length:792 start_codon:yes stop_codon:yes gene_type:complete
MAEDLQKLKKAILATGEQYAKTDQGKMLLAAMLASEKEVASLVPKKYSQDVTVEKAGKVAGFAKEVHSIYTALNNLNSEDAVKYANKGLKRLLKKADPETTIKLYNAVVDSQRVVEAKRKIGPGVATARFKGNKLDLSGIGDIDYDTPEYGVSVNPQTGTARGRGKIGPVDATAFVDPRAKYARVGGRYDAGRVGLFDTEFSGSGDTRGDFRAGARFSAPTERITDYLTGKPFSKAKGGMVKKYAKGGTVKAYSNSPRKPKLK